MTPNPRHLIIDDTGVLWSSDEYDALGTGSAIMAAVDASEPEGYREAVGES